MWTEWSDPLTRVSFVGYAMERQTAEVPAFRDHENALESIFGGRPLKIDLEAKFTPV